MKPTLTNLQVKLTGATAMFLTAASTIGFAFATDIVTKGISMSETMYGDLLKISTPIAAVSIVVALIVTYFSHDEKKIKAGRYVAIGIFVTWMVINGLGYFFTYGQNLIGDGGKVVFQQ